MGGAIIIIIIYVSLLVECQIGVWLINVTDVNASGHVTVCCVDVTKWVAFRVVV